MEQMVNQILRESLGVQEAFVETTLSGIVTLAERMVEAFKTGRKLLIAGNGGSAADAQHMAAEFVNRFAMERPPLPALALTTDTSILTSIGNDYGFDEIFSKQIRALGKKGDLLLVITTSGTSPNLLAAADTARGMGLFTAGLLGRDGGKVAARLDLPLIARSEVTARVQEAHALVIHILCHLVEQRLFGHPDGPGPGA